MGKLNKNQTQKTQNTQNDKAERDNLRIPKIILERCDREIGNKNAPRLRTVRIILDRCDKMIKKIKKVPAVTVAKTSLSPVQAQPPTNRETGTMGVRILQLNTKRSAVVTGEVRQLVAQKRFDVLLLQEPYVRKQGTSHTFYGLGTETKVAAIRSHRPWTMVAVSNPQLQLTHISQLSTTHCVCAEIQTPSISFYVVSCYFQYKDEIEIHLRHLETVLYSLRGQRFIVSVDANARSSLWGPQRTDERGNKFEDLISAHGLEILNDAGQGPTFETMQGTSFIDVTLASPTMIQFIGDWKVWRNWTSSDHNIIEIRLRVPRANGNERKSANNRFDISRADWEQFSKSLTDLSKSRLEVLDLNSQAEVEGMAVTLQEVIIEASEASMPRKRQFRKSNPWWTRELTSRKKEVMRLRRLVQKNKKRRNFDRLLLQDYRKYLQVYRKEVRKTKFDSWSNFVTSRGNEEPWGFVYKQQADKLKVEKVISTLRCGQSSTMTAKETAACLLDVHIPEDREVEDALEQQEIREKSKEMPNTANAPLFTGREIIKMAKGFKNNKAPGPDLVESRVLKEVVSIIPDQITRLFNNCLQKGVFPKVWKEGTLRVLLKGEDKDERDPKSYWPICLLSVIGKLYEKLIKARLEDTALAADKNSSRQYGFTPGRSTEDAIVEMRRLISTNGDRYAVALLFDISGAFDNVWWPLVLQSLKEKDCPRNVFGVLQPELLRQS